MSFDCNNVLRSSMSCKDAYPLLVLLCSLLGLGTRILLIITLLFHQDVPQPCKYSFVLTHGHQYSIKFSIILPTRNVRVDLRFISRCARNTKCRREIHQSGPMGNNLPIVSTIQVSFFLQTCVTSIALMFKFIFCHVHRYVTVNLHSVKPQYQHKNSLHWCPYVSLKS